MNLKETISNKEFSENVCVDSIHSGRRTSHIPLWQSFKKSPNIVGYCLALSSAILLYGYDLVIVGTVAAMPQFQLVFGQELNGKYIIPSMWLSLWNVSSCIGLMFGSILGGYYQDRRGRRITLAIGSFLSTIAVAICYISDLPDGIGSRRGVFFVGKFFQGICIGILLCVTQTYMSEVLPVALRGPVIAFYPIFTLLGQLVGSIVVYTSLKHTGAQSYRICFASQWPFSAVPFVLAAFLPESPTWLLRTGRTEKALKAQKKLDNDHIDSQAVIDELQASISAEDEESATHTYADCFKGVNMRRTMVVAFANMIPQMFGLQLLANASYFMQIVGMGSSNSLIFLILGIGLGLISNVISLWALNVFGRRLLILLTLGIVMVLWFAIGIAGIFKGTVTIWYTAVSMMAIAMVSGFGSWPASHVVAAEASSLQLRAKSQGIGWFTSGVGTAVFAIILPYIYNSDQGNLRAKTGFVMAGFAAVAVVGAWLAIPEMKVLKTRLNEANIQPLLRVMSYIGSIFDISCPSQLLESCAQRAQDSVVEIRSSIRPLTPFDVQALLLYSIAVYWCNETESGVELLDEAIRMAVALGMNKSEFARNHAEADSVLEESWRRTWWVIYITDAHIAGSTHTYPFRTSGIEITTDLPCEEEQYEIGVIPTPRSLDDYENREFLDEEKSDFSSYAELIGLTRGIDRALSPGNSAYDQIYTTMAASCDTSVRAWCSLLSPEKRELIHPDGSFDEVMFKAFFIMHTYTVEIHRPLSALTHSAIESVSRCAPLAPSAHLKCSNAKERDLHTVKCTQAINSIDELLTLPTNMTTHSPFIICMIANVTIAHLSACRFIFSGDRRAKSREKIRLTMGTLKRLSEHWTLGKRTYREIGIIARELLSLTTDPSIGLDAVDLSLPGPTSPAFPPLDTLPDANFDICAFFDTDALGLTETSSFILQ
ncbi:transcriptional regulator family: Fungal Specific TF [Penicillium roqueforti]|nr:transcriptional regulator family: Fungal Specific TF [Penicillium roqueforti]KAI2692646.1 transcriptional regulator family: Fungal Specific TF [Penicillium roqueforti]KAI2741598.1 transcriptional regulator family: Fungal Specific TF [Penicillium roqueforti]KAI2744618.1 transcriptional regulator family: Fungal Specific TF [Penicillium roqueforti]KAI2761177.1 transcriptional regulator family: Fungal Specific TF [Penicillium roqueforti]